MLISVVTSLILACEQAHLWVGYRGQRIFSPGSPVLGSLSPTQTSEPARRLVLFRRFVENMLPETRNEKRFNQLLISANFSTRVSPAL